MTKIFRFVSSEESCAPLIAPHISVCAKILHPSSEAEAFVAVEAAFMSRLHFVRFNLYLLINKGVEPSWWLSWLPDTKFWHT